jgi:hypothetical protein
MPPPTKTSTGALSKRLRKTVERRQQQFRDRTLVRATETYVRGMIGAAVGWANNLDNMVVGTAYLDPGSCALITAHNGLQRMVRDMESEGHRSHVRRTFHGVFNEEVNHRSRGNAVQIVPMPSPPASPLRRLQHRCAALVDDLTQCALAWTDGMEGEIGSVFNVPKVATKVVPPAGLTAAHVVFRNGEFVTANEADIYITRLRTATVDLLVRSPAQETERLCRQEEVVFRHPFPKRLPVPDPRVSITIPDPWRPDQPCSNNCMCFLNWPCACRRRCWCQCVCDDDDCTCVRCPFDCNHLRCPADCNGDECAVCRYCDCVCACESPLGGEATICDDKDCVNCGTPWDDCGTPWDGHHVDWVCGTKMHTVKWKLPLTDMPPLAHQTAEAAEYVALCPEQARDDHRFSYCYQFEHGDDGPCEDTPLTIDQQVWRVDFKFPTSRRSTSPPVVQGRQTATKTEHPRIQKPKQSTAIVDEPNEPDESDESDEPDEPDEPVRAGLPFSFVLPVQNAFNALQKRKPNVPKTTTTPTTTTTGSRHATGSKPALPTRVPPRAPPQPPQAQQSRPARTPRTPRTPRTTRSHRSRPTAPSLPTAPLPTMFNAERRTGRRAGRKRHARSGCLAVSTPPFSKQESVSSAEECVPIGVGTEGDDNHKSANMPSAAPAEVWPSFPSAPTPPLSDVGSMDDACRKYVSDASSVDDVFPADTSRAVSPMSPMPPLLKVPTVWSQMVDRPVDEMFGHLKNTMSLDTYASAGFNDDDGHKGHKGHTDHKDHKDHTDHKDHKDHDIDHHFVNAGYDPFGSGRTPHTPLSSIPWIPQLPPLPPSRQLIGMIGDMLNLDVNGDHTHADALKRLLVESVCVLSHW